MDGSIEDLIFRLTHLDPSARFEACELLGKMGDVRAVGPLIGRLADRYPSVRRAACESLGKIGDARAVEPLIGCLGNRVLRVRRAACEALGKIGDARAVDPLIGRLGDPEERMRQVARESLRRMGDARTVEPLIGRLGDQDWEVGKAACELLGEIGDARAVEPLIGYLGNRVLRVRRTACEALVKIGEVRIARAVIGSIDGRPEALAELRSLAADGDFRAQDPMVLSFAWSPVAARAVSAITNALKSQWRSLLCSACLSRIELKREQEAEWYGCRVCGKLGHALMGIENVVAVLDEGWPEERRREGGVLRVNWLRRKALFDFDSVEIVRVSDLEAERFCIAVGNDMDEWRRARYRGMTCRLSHECVLAETAVRNLRAFFGEVSRRD